MRVWMAVVQFICATAAATSLLLWRLLGRQPAPPVPKTKVCQQDEPSGKGSPRQQASDGARKQRGSNGGRRRAQSPAAFARGSGPSQSEPAPGSPARLSNAGRRRAAAAAATAAAVAGTLGTTASPPEVASLATPAAAAPAAAASSRPAAAPVAGASPAIAADRQDAGIVAVESSSAAGSTSSYQPGGAEPAAVQQYISGSRLGLQGPGDSTATVVHPREAADDAAATVASSSHVQPQANTVRASSPAGAATPIAGNVEQNPVANSVGGQNEEAGEQLAAASGLQSSRSMEAVALQAEDGDNAGAAAAAPAATELADAAARPSWLLADTAHASSDVTTAPPSVLDTTVVSPQALPPQRAEAEPSSARSLSGDSAAAVVNAADVAPVLEAHAAQAVPLAAVAAAAAAAAASGDAAGADAEPPEAQHDAASQQLPALSEDAPEQELSDSQEQETAAQLPEARQDDEEAAQQLADALGLAPARSGNSSPDMESGDDNDDYAGQLDGQLMTPTGATAEPTFFRPEAGLLRLGNDGYSTDMFGRRELVTAPSAPSFPDIPITDDPFPSMPVMDEDGDACGVLAANDGNTPLAVDGSRGGGGAVGNRAGGSSATTSPAVASPSALREITDGANLLPDWLQDALKRPTQTAAATAPVDGRIASPEPGVAAGRSAGGAYPRRDSSDRSAVAPPGDGDGADAAPPMFRPEQQLPNSFTMPRRDRGWHASPPMSPSRLSPAASPLQSPKTSGDGVGRPADVKIYASRVSELLHDAQPPLQPGRPSAEEDRATSGQQQPSGGPTNGDAADSQPQPAASFNPNQSLGGAAALRTMPTPRPLALPAASQPTELSPASSPGRLGQLLPPSSPSRFAAGQKGSPRLAIGGVPSASASPQNTAGAAAAAAAATADTRLQLRVLSGPAAGTSFATSDASRQIRIGRYPDCDLLVNDAEISGKHAVISWNGGRGGWGCTDAGSLNGSMLNGTVISKVNRAPGEWQPLRNKDVLQFGGVTKVQVQCSRGAGAISPGALPAAAAAAAAGTASPRRSGGGAVSTLGGGRSPSQNGQLLSAPVSSFAGGAGAVAPAVAGQQQQQPDAKSKGPGAVASPQPPQPYLGKNAEAFSRSLTWHATHKDKAFGHPSTAAAGRTVDRRSLDSQPFEGPPVTISFPPCRLDAAILKRTGIDHRRQDMPAEDVAHWDCPFPAPSSSSPSPSSSGGNADGPDRSSCCLFCIFDGHHGRGAAEEAKVLLPKQLALRCAGRPRVLSPADACTESLTGAFLDTDAAIKSDDGCTATAVVLEAGDDGAVLLAVANVGDSDAVYVNTNSRSFFRLSEDHRIAHNSEEQSRIQAKSGIATQQRLYGLNIARMLGDRFLKEEDIGFSATPHVSPVHVLQPEDETLLLMASDGLWDVLSTERAAGMVLGLAAKGPMSAAAVAEALMAHAVQQRSKDDITIIVLKVASASSLRPS